MVIYIKKYIIILICLLCLLLTSCSYTKSYEIPFIHKNNQTKNIISQNIETEKAIPFQKVVEDNASLLMKSVEAIEQEAEFLTEEQKKLLQEATALYELYDLKQLGIDSTTYIKTDNKYYLVTDLSVYQSKEQLELELYKNFSYDIVQNLINKKVYINDNNKLYAKNIERDKNKFYIATEYELISQNENNIIFNAIATYIENGKLNKYSTEYELTNDNNLWKLSKFELLY